MSTSHFWGNLDKFLLTCFVIYFSLFAYFSMHSAGPANPFQAAMLDNEKLVMGALLGLITGRALGRMQDAQAPPPASKN